MTPQERVAVIFAEPEFCAENYKGETDENGLPHGATPGNAADEERCRHTPHHPVCPVIDGPVLGEIARS